jgi:hypothetical protein
MCATEFIKTIDAQELLEYSLAKYTQQAGERL